MKSIGNSLKSLFYSNKKKDKDQQDDEENKEDDLMAMINTQDFIGGFRGINKKTSTIKKKYEKEFNNLKKI